MRIELKRKFPCGYETYLWVSSGILGKFKIDDTDKDGCPIHGKNCKSEKAVGK